MKHINALRHLAHAMVAAITPACASQTFAATSEVVYFHTDALGSPTAAFNEDGDVCWRETYTPYGKKVENDDNGTKPDGCGLLGTDVGYTGHVQDTSGLVYAQQRYYDPEIGRFLSVDPVRPNAVDPRYFGRYQYGGNSPYRYVDPDGENFVDSIEQSLVESFEGLTGLGDGEFNGGAIGDALADGYDGKRGVRGIVAAAAEDVLSLFGGWVVSGLARSANVATRVVSNAAITLSKAKFGHTFTRHGEDATEFLINRAKGSKKPQGQFLDNQAAAKLIQDNLDKASSGAVSIPVPKDFPARIINPDGTFSPASTIRIVPGGKGVKSAYPEP